MIGRREPLLEWVKRQRDVNALQLDLMSNWFDLDGAMRAGQWELAWRAREGILTAGVELFLSLRGVRVPASPDGVDRLCGALELLAGLNPPLADVLWDLVLREGPPDEQDFRREMEAAVTVVRERLGIPLEDRLDSIALWADGVRVLRDVAAGLHVAGADNWYLSAEDPSAQLGWYDEVLAILDEQRKAGTA